ncbi:MAG: hypothetical protein P8129_22755, partial [Anaerolineae bacterium]
MKAEKGVVLAVLVLVTHFLLAGCGAGAQGGIAFTHVNLVPMTAEIIIEDQTVVIEGGLIVAIGDAADVRIPAGARVIEGQGAYLMPGLADMHMHTRLDWQDRDVWPVDPLHLYLANGVTTIRDLGPTGSPLEYALHWRNEIRAGTRHGVGLDGALAAGMDEVAHVEELLPELIDFDRSADLAPAEWLPYLAGAAAEQWHLAAGRLPAGFGAENLETRDHVAGRLRSGGVPVCTTMVIDDIIQWKLFRPAEFLARPENVYQEQGYLDSLRRGEEKHQLQFAGQEGLAAAKYDVDRWLLDGLHRAGVVLLLGTDSGTGGMGLVPGYSIHDELRILVDNGFTPYEAITTGTVNAALVVERMTGEG